MNNEAFRAMFASPAAFRDVLKVRTKSGMQLLGPILADFQKEALQPLDEAVIALAAGRTPSCKNIYLEMTKGSAKTTLVVADLLWLLLFASVPFEGRIGAGNALQADESRQVILNLRDDNDWLDSAILILES